MSRREVSGSRVFITDLDVTSYTVGGRCPPNINVINYKFLSQGLSVLGVKCTSYRCTPILDEMTRP